MSEFNSVGSVIEHIIRKQEKMNPQNAGDYIGNDGFLYCGNCGTAKQCEISCLGKKYIVPILCSCEKEKQLEEEARKESLKRIERVKSLRKNSLMDEKFESCCFETTVINDSNKRQFDNCKRYADNFEVMLEKNQGLLLYGGVGTGKTHFACCIGNKVINDLKTVLATSLIKVLEKAKSFKNSDDEASYISRISDIDLLILDDLGAERSTDYALEIVYNVINSRYRSKKPMIVTTNLSLDEMRNTNDIRYKRIYDRVFEVCYPIEFSGKSWRMKEAANRFDEMRAILGG